jgi:hypothetical protein
MVFWNTGAWETDIDSGLPRLYIAHRDILSIIILSKDTY